MERRYQCSSCVLLCGGGWDSWLEAALYVLAAWYLVCSCTMSARSPSGFREEAEQTCLNHLASSDLFIIAFLAMLLLIQKNDQQQIKGFSFQLSIRPEKQEDEVDHVAC